MNWKRHLRELAHRHFGLRVFSDGSLPAGADWLRDLRWLSPPLRAAPVFFDVGANIGQTAHEMHRAFPRARIFAFEPVAATFALLQANTRDIPGLRAFPLALGAQPGRGRILSHEKSDSNILLVGENSAPSELPLEDVQIDTLDRFCAAQNLERIDVLKIDTEGHELAVLRGGAELLAAGCVRYIYVEVAFAPDNTRNTSFFALHEHLSSRGFRFLGLSEQYFMHHNPEPLAFCNALFTRRGAEK